MENQINLREISETNGFTYAESTSGSNGYPSNIKGIIIGFENFKDAENLAEKHNLSVEFFKKKDGWQLWERTGNQAHEPMKNSSEDYGDNYSQFEKISESEFIDNEVSQVLRDALEDKDRRTFDFLETFLAEKKKLFNEIEIMEDDEMVITCHGDYYETIKKQSMYWAHDTRHITIGLIDRS